MLQKNWKGQCATRLTATWSDVIMEKFIFVEENVIKGLIIGEAYIVAVGYIFIKYDYSDYSHTIQIGKCVEMMLSIMSKTNTSIKATYVRCLLLQSNNHCPKMMRRNFVTFWDPFQKTLNWNLFVYAHHFEVSAHQT